MKRVAVIGSGAMGCLFGAYLSEVADVVLFDTWRAHVQAMREHGLLLEELDRSRRQCNVTATDRVEEIGVVDTALICVKSHQTRWATDVAAAVLRADGVAVTLQNGLGNREILAGILGGDRVIQGVTAHGATLLGPGEVRHAGQGPTHLAVSISSPERARQVANLLEGAGFEVHLSQDLDSLIWGKLVINAGINGLTAILRVANGQLAENAPARELLAQAVQEAVQVAAGLGISLPYPDGVERTLEVCRATASNRSSMLQDVLRGSPTEIDFINGVIVRQGQELRLATPVNCVVVLVLQAIERSYGVRV